MRFGTVLDKLTSVNHDQWNFRCPLTNLKSLGFSPRGHPSLLRKISFFSSLELCCNCGFFADNGFQSMPALFPSNAALMVNVNEICICNFLDGRFCGVI